MAALFLARRSELYDYKGSEVAAFEHMGQGCQQGVGEAFAPLMLDADAGKNFHSAPNFDSTGPRFFPVAGALIHDENRCNRSKLSIFLQDL